MDLATAQRILDHADGSLRAEAVSWLGDGIKSDVWLIATTDGQRYAAKVFKHEFARSVTGEDWFYSQLARGASGGIDGIPERLVSIDDPAVLDVPVTVHRYTPGKMMIRANGFSDEDQFDSYRSLGRVLRQLHEIDQPHFASFPDNDESTRSETNRDYMTRRWAHAWNQYAEGGSNRYLASRIRSFLLERDDVWDRCTSPKLLHGDPHPANVIVERGDDGVVRFRALIDFESSVSGDPIFDLANSIFKSVGDREAKLRSLLDGYGELPDGWRESFDTYVVYIALVNWTFVARYGARKPLKVLDRELAELTGASRTRILRSALRPRLPGR